MTFRAGIIGCGRIGSEFDEQNLPTHAGAYSAASQAELVAVCDLLKEKLEKCGRRWGVTSLYENYKEMLMKEDLDILSIVTRASNHLEIAQEAVTSSVKAIYCEKPITDTLRHADEMIRLCNEKAVILQVNHQRRFDSFYQEVKDFFRAGKLGRIQQFTFYYTRGIANTGSHMFDLLRFFFGDVDWVQASYSQNKSHDSEDPNIDGIVKFGDRLLCEIKARDDQNITIFDMDCIGTNGRLNIIRNGSEVEYYEVREGRLLRGTCPVNVDVPRNSMVEAVEHLIECVREGKRPICSGEDGRASLELVCAFHESAEADGKKVSLPLADSEIEIKSR